MTLQRIEKKKLIIHLGPPKTGTTSFQFLLQDVKSERWHYGGVTQPRSGKMELSKRILGFCSRQTDDLENILLEIEGIIYKKDVFISEEMLLVHQMKSSLTDKLERLKLITDNFRTTFVYVERDVGKVLPSYYQERFQNLPKKYQDSFEEFCLSEYCRAYDLSFVRQKLGTKSCFKTLEFEDFTRKDQDLFELLPFEILKGLTLSQSIHNQGSMHQNNRILARKSNPENWILLLAKCKPSFIPRLGIINLIKRFFPALRKKEQRELKISGRVLDHFRSSGKGKKLSERK